MVQRARGTRDFAPEEMAARLALERRFDQVASRHGFRRVQTPTFEPLDLFTAKSGPSIVSELYAFEDKGGRPLTLRPELTAPVMRMVAAEMTHVPHPLRLCYFGNCFRYEEFKTARYREFWQYGCEIVGASGPLVEAETIAFAAALIEAAGVRSHLRIGHVGVLRGMLTAAGMEGDAIGEVMRRFDKGDLDGVSELVPEAFATALSALAAADRDRASIDDARKVMEGVGVDPTPLDELAATLDSLSHLLPEASPIVDLTVARGLDYYTGVVFEFDVEELAGEGQICGGGSYRLMHLFGHEDLDPCCGFGLGFDRILLAADRQAEADADDQGGSSATTNPGTLAIIPFRIDSSSVLPLVSELRAAGESVMIELRSRKVQRSIHWADSAGAGFVLVAGPRDLETGTGSVKRLSDGAEHACDLTVASIATALATLR